jgi:hypothetical protein
MADQWRPENAIDGRYVWLPIRIGHSPDGRERLAIEWQSEWDLSAFDRPDLHGATLPPVQQWAPAVATEEEAARSAALRLSPEAMAAWQDARVGLFIHWGLYALLGRGEWAMHREGSRHKSMPDWPSAFTPQQL